MYPNYIYFLSSAWCCSVVLSNPTTVKSTMKLVNYNENIHKEENKSVNLEQVIIKATESDVNDMHNKIPANISRIRVKRQNSGAGKFADASKMPQLKLLRLFLQMFKNSWDSAYVGGAHPLHHNVPKVIVSLYKQNVVEFFIPDVGDDSKHTK